MPFGNVSRTRAQVQVARALGYARPRRRLPRQLEPTPIMNEYGEAILRVVEYGVTLCQPLLDAMPSLLARAQRERSDSAETDIIDRIQNQLRTALVRKDLEDMAGRYAVRTASFQRGQLERQVNAALGVNPLIADKGLQSRLQGFATENVALIRGIPETMVLELEKLTTRAIQDGRLWPDVSKDMQDRFDISRRRADFIARDQVGKLYGQVNAARQKELGVEHFFWRSVDDERVRDEHEERNGNRYSYEDPPDGELPGEPILCRCQGEPDFSSILQGL